MYIHSERHNITIQLTLKTREERSAIAHHLTDPNIKTCQTHDTSTLNLSCRWIDSFQYPSNICSGLRSEDWYTSQNRKFLNQQDQKKARKCVTKHFVWQNFTRNRSINSRIVVTRFLEYRRQHQVYAHLQQIGRYSRQIRVQLHRDGSASAGGQARVQMERLDHRNIKGVDFLERDIV